MGCTLLALPRQKVNQMVIIGFLFLEGNLLGNGNVSRFYTNKESGRKTCGNIAQKNSWMSDNFLEFSTR